jgi:steroid delta-isomerase-like uncharacterized protein
MTNAELVRTVHADFCAGRLDAVTERALPSITVDAVPFGTVFHGREGLMAFMGTFRNAFPDIQLRHVNVVESGDQVTVEATWTGTHTGPLSTPQGDIPATGRRVTKGRICEVFRIQNGRLASITNYQDVGTWMRELGLV